MHRVNRSVPWKEQAKTRLAPDLTVRECQKWGWAPSRRREARSRVSDPVLRRADGRDPRRRRGRSRDPTTTRPDPRLGMRLREPDRPPVRRLRCPSTRDRASPRTRSIVAALTSKTFGLDDLVQVEVAVPFHCIDQHRDQRLQALAANPIGRFPQHGQRLAHCLVVEPVPMRAAFAVATPSRSTRIACLR